MNHSQRLILLLIVAIGILIHVEAYIFYIEGVQTRCFKDQFPVDSKVLGEYLISDAFNQRPALGDMKIDMTIRSADKKVVLLKRDIDQGKFSFDATPASRNSNDFGGYDDDYNDIWGDQIFEICFESVAERAPKMPKRRVNFKLYTRDFEGDVASKQDTGLAKKEHVDKLYQELSFLWAYTNALDKEVNFAQLRENKLININSATYGRVYNFHGFAIFFLVAITILQTYYLKNFFRKKKVI